jgi:GNAT superfamily N-acetyltransferase
MKIEKAQNSDAKELTELTIRSKSYWSYSSEQIALWKDELTITAQYIDQVEIYKLSEENQLIGYYSYLELDDKKVKLDNIFLEPRFIGKGYGKVLMSHLIQQIKDRGFEMIEIDSEPYAEKFYQKIGFRVTGQLESSIKNRFLPIMELDVKSIQNDL